MSFPEGDRYWLDVVEFADVKSDKTDRILAPSEFKVKLSNIYDYSYSWSFQISDFILIIVHKDKIKEINYSFCQQLGQLSSPVFANEVFIIFSGKNNLKKLNHNSQHLQPFWQELKIWQANIQKFSNQQAITIPERTTPSSQPNLNPLNQRLLFAAEALALNIKTLGYEYARNLKNNLSIPQNLSPQKIVLSSQVCQQKDIESLWFWYWCQVMQIPINYHRKNWEFAYILQALYNYDLLTPGKKGLGFGCGEEPLPSVLAAYNIDITATDLDPDESAAKGWIETNQSMSSLEKIWYPDLCSKDLFDRHVRLEYVDMNDINDNLNNQYDFCWSACSLEHLGSIKHGLNFIENSLDTLVPGGLAVHTTEFNYLEEEETIDNWGTVLFRKKDFQTLKDKLTTLGHKVQPLNFDVGEGVLDRFIDLPPYDGQIHRQDPKDKKRHEVGLKLLIDGFASTSFGVIIQKSFN